MGFQISLCQFHKNSLSGRLLEGKDVTLWDELTEHKAVSQKASFQFLTEDSSFFNIALYLLHNITLLILQEQSLRKASWGESCNTVWSINGKQSSVSERFLPVFNGRYFLFHHRPLWTSKNHFQIPQKQSWGKASWGEICNSMRWIKKHKAVSQKSSFQFLTEDIFFFATALYGLPNITS